MSDEACGIMTKPDLLHDNVQAILARVGLNAPDGRPLYRYRLTSSESEVIREGLIEALEPGMDITSSTARAFCLWSADHYSRAYDGGAHQWFWILDSLGFEEDGIEHAERKELVLRGLRFWRRETIRSGRQELFLETLIREGGLPIALLRDEASRVSSYFRSLFDSVEQHSVAGKLTRPGEELASELALRCRLNRLSAPYIAQLSSELVLGVRRLARGIPKGAEPIAALDAAEPRWRDELPLRLDDDTAKSFLEGLLKDAVAARTRMPTTIRWDRLLRGDHRGDAGWRWRLTGRLNVPSQAALDVVRMLPTTAALAPKDSLFDRFTLETRYEDGSSDDWARGRRQYGEVEGNDTLYFDSSPRSRQALEGMQVAGRVELSLRAQGRQTEPTAEFPGGWSLSGDPWVFVDEFADDVDLASLSAGAAIEAPLVAQASCRVKSARAIVAITATMQIRYDDGTLPLSLGTLDVTPPRELYQIDRSAVVDGEISGEKYSIRTSVAIGGTEHIDPDGRSLRLGPERITAYIGVPRLRYTVGGDEQPIPLGELQWWRAGRTVDPQPLSRALSPVGTGRIRWVRDGAVRYSIALTLLPAGFRWSIEPRAGTLSFGGLNGAEVEVLADSDVETEVERSDSQHVTIRAKAKPLRVPSTLRIRFSWPTGSTRDLPFPFPAVVTRFAHRAEGPIHEQRTIAVHQLAQYVAMSVQPDGAAPKPLVGRLALRAGAHKGATGIEQEFEQPFPPLQDDTTTLPLNLIRDRITDLFAGTLDRDALVRLQLRGSVEPQIIVQRYDLDARPSATGGFRLLPGSWAALSPRERSTLRMRAYDLLNPRADAVALEAIDSSDVDGPLWTAPRNEPLEGMWIAALFDGDLVRSRPRLLPGISTPVDATNERTPLQEALGILPERERRDAIAQALVELAANPLADGWSLVMAVLQRTTVLPPAIFDVLQEIIEMDAAVAAFTIRAAWDGEETSQLAWDTLQALPCGLHGIDRGTWVTAIENAFAGCAEFAERSKMPFHLLHSDIRATRQRVLQHVPWVEPLWDANASRYGIQAPPNRASQGADNPAFAGALATRVREAMKVAWQPSSGDLPAVHTLNTCVAGQPAIEEFMKEFPVGTTPPEYRSILRAPLQIAALSVLSSQPVPLAARMQYRTLVARYSDWADTLHKLAYWYAGLRLTK